uniref:TniQ family protein n=1 Tax=Rhodococcus qingshengii TaxID=334542 RepID=UPI001C4DFD5B|nr:TniQ family protein [Rhodococcus qingshengii]
MTSRLRPSGQARQLPIPVPPAMNETIESYLRRLAVVNHISNDTLKRHLGLDPTRLGLRIRPGNLARLVVITGYSREQLTRALPQLSDLHTDSGLLEDWPRPACLACTNRHRGGPVTRYYPSYVHACPKHQIWFSGGQFDRGRVLDISGTPAVLAAHSRHRRLAQQRGPQPTQYAFNVARGVWNNLDSFPTFSGVKERLGILDPDARRFIALDDCEYLAASYPNVVNTAALLASPHWRRVASRQRTCNRFLTELGWRTSGERRPYWPQGKSDPIVKWIEGLTRASIDWNMR